MRIVYSIGATVAGHGIGRPAGQAVRGLYRHGMLRIVLCGSCRGSPIPPEHVRQLGRASRGLRKLAALAQSRHLLELHHALYDRWAARHVGGADLFHGWNGHCLRSLERAAALGMATVVERGSCHPLFQARLLQDEYARWGLSWRPGAAGPRRSLAELQRADRVVVPSEFARRSFLAEGFPPERLIRVPFGVDVAHYRPAPPRARSVFRVLFVGQCGLPKGLPYLLAAWQRLAWRGAELWIAGRTSRDAVPLLRPYRDAPGVRWLGFVPDPAELYRAADVFAFPSLQEGSALVVYEALASGLPVITTDNAGSVVREGREGFIVPARDVDRLAGALERLRGAGALRADLGRAARARAEEFTWEAYGDALAAALRGGRSAPAPVRG
jgi:glycosyltransferase involved in cell wall biosynthesis